MESKSYEFRHCILSLTKYIAVIIAFVATRIYESTIFSLDNRMREYIFTVILIAIGIIIIALFPLFFFQGKKYFSDTSSSPQRKKHYLRKFFLGEMIIVALLVLICYIIGKYYGHIYRMSISAFMAIDRDWSLAGKSFAWFLRMAFMIFLGFVGVLQWALFFIGFRLAKKTLKRDIC